MGWFGSALKILQKERAVSLDKAQKIDEALKKNIQGFRAKFVKYENSEMYEVQRAQQYCAAKNASTRAIEKELILLGEDAAVEEKVIHQLAIAEQMWGALKSFAARDFKNTKPQEVIRDLTLAADRIKNVKDRMIKFGAGAVGGASMGTARGPALRKEGEKFAAIVRRITAMKLSLQTRDPYSLRKSLGQLIDDMGEVVRTIKPKVASLAGSKEAKIFFRDYSDQEHALSNAAILGRQSLLDLKKCGVAIPNSLLNELNRAARYHRLARNVLRDLAK